MGNIANIFVIFKYFAAIGFFEHINLLYGTVSEFCNLTSCPEMTGPGPRVYMWLDDKGKKSKLSAPQYVDYVMTYVQKVVNDEAMFPTKHGNEFPANFDQVLRKIQKLLFHVVAHIYHSHFREIVLLGLHAHLNSIFAHIIEYNFFYHILEDKELEVLQDLTHALKLAPDKSSVNTSSGSEETAKDQSASEDTNTKEPSVAEDISKDISKDKEAGEESITSESDVKIVVEDKEKEEAVTICDEENTTADVEKAPSTEEVAVSSESLAGDDGDKSEEVAKT